MTVWQLISGPGSQWHVTDMDIRHRECKMFFHEIPTSSTFLRVGQFEHKKPGQDWCFRPDFGNWTIIHRLIGFNCCVYPEVINQQAYIGSTCWCDLGVAATLEQNSHASGFRNIEERSNRRLKEQCTQFLSVDFLKCFCDSRHFLRLLTKVQGRVHSLTQYYSVNPDAAGCLLGPTHGEYWICEIIPGASSSSLTPPRSSPYLFPDINLCSFKARQADRQAGCLHVRVSQHTNDLWQMETSDRRQLLPYFYITTVCQFWLIDCFEIGNASHTHTHTHTHMLTPHTNKLTYGKMCVIQCTCLCKCVYILPHVGSMLFQLRDASKFSCPGCVQIPLSIFITLCSCQCKPNRLLIFTSWQ